MRNKVIHLAAMALAGLLAAAAGFAQGSPAPMQGNPAAQENPAAQGNPAAQPQEPPSAEPPSAEPPAPSNPGAPATPAAPRVGGGMSSGGAASAEVAAPDKSFIQEAAHANLEEVELGRLAAEKAADPDVKAFAQKMVDDHAKANDQLKQVATVVKVVVPSGLTSRSKSEKAKLEKLSGPAFDRAYVEVVIKGHEKDIQEFTREAKREMAPGGVKNLASAQLSSLKDHLKMAEDLRTKLGSSATGAASPGHR